MGFVKPHVTILIGGGVVALAFMLQIGGLASNGWITGAKISTDPGLISDMVSSMVSRGDSRMDSELGSSNFRTIVSSMFSRINSDIAMLKVRAGLWKVCVAGFCLSKDDAEDWMGACHAFGIVAVLALAGSLACAALTCFLSGKKFLPLLASVAAASGASCALIEFAVFAGEIQQFVRNQPLVRLFINKTISNFVGDLPSEIKLILRKLTKVDQDKIIGKILEDLTVEYGTGFALTIVACLLGIAAAVLFFIGRGGNARPQSSPGAESQD